MTLLIGICAGGLVVIVGLRALIELPDDDLLRAGRQPGAHPRPRELYAHLNALSMSFHDRRRTGDLVTRVTGDVGRLQEAAVTAMVPLVGNLLTLGGMLVVIAVLDWQLALVVLVVFPLFLLISTRLTRKIVGVSRGQRAAEGNLASLATESLASMAVVQSYSLESRMQERVRRQQPAQPRRRGPGQEAVRRAGAQDRRAGRHRHRPGALLRRAPGAHRQAHPRRADRVPHLPQDGVQTAARHRQVHRPDRQGVRLRRADHRRARRADRDRRRQLGSARPPAFRGYVEFENVHLAYGPATRCCAVWTSRVHAGQRVAVVGPSGAGKSSLMALLCRLRDPDLRPRPHRRPRPDGPDAGLGPRGRSPIVLQDSVLFASSIRDNIALGSPDPVTDEQIVAAARLAGAHDFVPPLPEGYDTVVGERGATLSGGQRQRIAIARAAIRNAPIIILDEALTGLDRDTESEVSAALDRLTASRTTFVITHDLAAAEGLRRRGLGRTRAGARPRAAPDEVLPRTPQDPTPPHDPTPQDPTAPEQPMEAIR